MAQAVFPLTTGDYYVDGVKIRIMADKILVDTGDSGNAEHAKPKGDTLKRLAGALNNMNDAISGKR